MALVSSYPGFIFDFGGVLVRHQTEADQARLAEAAGIPQPLFQKLYWAHRVDYDKGLVTALEYWTGVAQSAGATLTAAGVEELTELDVQSWMQFDSVMWDWVAELRGAGKRVAMLSNMPSDLGQALRTRTERLDCFDHVTLSYEVRSAKPEAAAFEHCLEGLGMPADQILFLDDHIANVQAAESLGIRSIQFTDRDEILLRVRS
ncbi:MAG TPA: HAD family phosphatase [Bryobacteraceae bacterium]|jgi:putative hydrolase of the HAD superfamily|nr:HAD family phosphatase [Bryobacteraceae bacterium]